jgi:murein DD-endopeptidase MepM/ murein hydrolase activator NlpD
MNFKTAIFLLLPMLGLAWACVEKKAEEQLEQTPKPGQEKGVWHQVEPGQTLWRICKAYGVDMEIVAKANKIENPTQLLTGQKIFIPGAEKVLAITPYQPSPGAPQVQPKELQPEPPDVFEAETVTYTTGRLQWPVDGGKVFSDFGTRKGHFHEGIDIAADPGTPVFAAADGKVVYCDNSIRGYGNMIVIKHAGNLSTVYAHNRMNLVKEGDFVKKGDKIAEVGSTGKTTGPHLHFEVRAGKEAVDPLKYFEKVQRKNERRK